MKYLCLALIVSVSVASGDKWPNLITTFSINPFASEAFHERPLTQADAESAGWQLIGSCDGTFLGHRFGQADDPSLVLIYDDAGYIAGVQSGVLKSEVNFDLFPIDTNPVYQLSSGVNGEELYYSTAYFVDPSLICGGGRTADQFDQQGTGDRLLIQNGSQDNLLTIPMTQDEADADDMWNDHYCFIGMGDHYMTFNYQPDQDCTSVFPLQILYDGGVINGFVWQHLAYLSGDKWEHPDNMAINAIVDSPPTCLVDLVDTPGISTMHHYFYNNPYLTLCPLKWWWNLNGYRKMMTRRY